MLREWLLASVVAFIRVSAYPTPYEAQDDVWALWEKNGHRMALVLMDAANITQPKIQECLLIGDNVIIREMLKNIPAENVKIVETQAMTHVISECMQLYQSKPGHKMATVSHSIGDWITGNFMIPGTKWCGPGDIAETYDDLGPEAETDKCCRTHDHCNDSISALKEKYGLKNKAIHSKCHCDCDDKLQACLKKVGTDHAAMVGNIFFNKLQVQCFKMEHPIIKCISYQRWILFYSCQEYELDHTKPHMWQFFDAKYFEMPTNVARKTHQHSMLFKSHHKMAH